MAHVAQEISRAISAAAERNFMTRHDNSSLNYNAFNVYRRELAPGTVSLTGDRAQGDDSKHWANSNSTYLFIYTIFQEGDIFSSTASLPYGPRNI